MTDDKPDILVVDDEKTIRDGCNRVLSTRGYTVTGAENGQVALDILQKQPVDVILLDLKMPVMDGETLLEILKERYADIPVIIITGHGTVDTAVNCMKKGAYDFITKPFQIDPFLLTIARAAEKRRLEQQAKRFQEENSRNLYDLSLEKSRLRTIINCLANGIMVTNRNLEVVLHNPALMRLLELGPDTAFPASVKAFLQDEDLIGTLKKIQSGESAPDATVAREIQAGRRFLRAISAPALGPEDGVVGTVTVLEDITPFKQLDAMKTDFVHMVAHELRSPLVSIRQQQSVMLEGLAGPLDPKQKDFIARGMKKIDGLLDLINDLLDIAKIESAHTVQTRVPTDLRKIIEETVALMEPRAGEQGVTVRFTARNLAPISADPKHMDEVMTNLISNAINYSPDGGEVTITAEGQGEYVEIKVQDRGIGIAPEELPKIFDKFYRVKNPKTRQVMGTGLGLAIVKGVIEAHHGSIDVESVPDGGTTFRILLPAIAP